jgi:hypothetical protein
MADNEKKGAGLKLLALALVIGVVGVVGFNWREQQEDAEVDDVAEAFVDATDPAAGFRQDIEAEVGWTGEAADAAIDLTETTCSNLAGVSGGDAVAAALDPGFDAFDGEHQVLADVLALGVEHYCPQHTDAVADYLEGRGLSA